MQFIRTCCVTASLFVLAGCAGLPFGGEEHLRSQAPRERQQYQAQQDRPVVAYKAQSGQVDPKIQPYSVMGKTYWPVQSALGFREEGYASWYGIDFHGKKTATGETYDMFSVSAAHKTLPLGSKVRVTNMENGRELELTVNDRGPFVDGRIIDLSYASARLLGMADNGLARVRVEGVGDNPVLAGKAGVNAIAVASAGAPRRKGGVVERTIVEEPARPAVAAKAEKGPELASAEKPVRVRRIDAPEPKAEPKAVPQPESGRYAVQVGAFSQDDNARRVQTRLVQSGFTGARITKSVRGGRELMVVHAGAFQQKEQAEEALRRLKDEFPASFISSSGA